MSGPGDSRSDSAQARSQNLASDLGVVVDTGPFGYATAGPTELIDGMNRTLAGWVGRSADSVIGTSTFQDLLAPGDRIYYDTHVRPMLSMGGKVREIAVELVRADGSRLPVLMNAVQRTGTDGEARLDVIVIDATERRRYERELLHERRVAEQAQERLQVMYDVVSGLAAATSADEIAAVIAERGQHSLAGARCSVWLLDGDRRTLRRAAKSAGDEQTYPVEPVESAIAPLLDGELVTITDVDQADDAFPRLSTLMRMSGLSSATIAPLSSADGVRGVVFFGFEEVHEFTTAERDSIASLARQAEQALERTRVSELERRSRERIEALYRFSTRLAGAVSVDEVLEVIGGVSVDLLGAARVRLALPTGRRRAVRFVQSTSLDAEDDVELPVDARAVGCAVISTGQVVELADRNELQRSYPDSPLLAAAAFGRVIGVPLVRDDVVLGAWVLAYAEAFPPDADDITLVHLFAEQASQAMGRAFYHHRLEIDRGRTEIRLAISEALNAAETSHDVARAITTQGRSAFDASALCVWMDDHHTPDTFRVSASAGVAATDPMLESEVRRADFVALLEGPATVPRYLDGAALHPLVDRHLADPGWKVAILVPIYLNGQLTGLVVAGFGDPTTATPAVRVALAGLAGEAAVAIGRARQYELEHEVALTLQNSLLPARIPELENYSISARYEPGTDHLLVGGDVFDVIRTDDGRLVVIVGDVVGHGVQAAASMGQLRSAARALALTSSDPPEILGGLEAFAASEPGVLYATVACVSLDPDGRGRYACAGHPYPVIASEAGAIELLQGGRSPLLGISRSPKAMDEFRLDAGSSLVLYTDGVIEFDATDIDGGTQRLRAVLEHLRPGDGPFDADAIVDTIMAGAQPQDDVVVVCVTRLAG